jgi:hypothetical protein
MIRRAAADKASDLDAAEDDPGPSGTVDDYRAIYRSAIEMGNMPTALHALNALQALTAPAKLPTPEQQIELDSLAFARETVTSLRAVDGGISALMTRLLSRKCQHCGATTTDTRSPCEPPKVATTSKHDLVIEPNRMGNAETDPSYKLASLAAAQESRPEPKPKRESEWDRLIRLGGTAREQLRTMRGSADAGSC